MANPQVENGFSKIANEFFDALIRNRIPGEQRQCFDLIIRQTWGWNKISDNISLSVFQQKTLISRKSINDALKALKEKNMIEINKEGYTNNYKINKNFDSWILPKKKSGVKNVTSGENPTSGENVTTYRGENPTSSRGKNPTIQVGGKTPPTKDNGVKDKIKENLKNTLVETEVSMKKTENHFELEGGLDVNITEDVQGAQRQTQNPPGQLQAGISQSGGAPRISGENNGEAEKRKSNGIKGQEISCTRGNKPGNRAGKREGIVGGETQGNSGDERRKEELTEIPVRAGTSDKSSKAGSGGCNSSSNNSKPKHPTLQVIDIYKKLFEERFGELPDVKYGKDTAIAKRLLNTYTIDDLRRLLTKFFESRDKFITRTGYTMGVFSSVAQKLSLEGKTKQEVDYGSKLTNHNVAAMNDWLGDKQ